VFLLVHNVEETSSRPDPDPQELERRDAIESAASDLFASPKLLLSRHKTLHSLGVTAGGTDVFRGNRRSCSANSKAGWGLRSIGEGFLLFAHPWCLLSAARGPVQQGRTLPIPGGLTVESYALISQIFLCWFSCDRRQPRLPARGFALVTKQAQLAPL